MEGDVVDFELRMMNVLRGPHEIDTRIEVRKRFVVFESGASRQLEWGEWEPIGRGFIQTMSLAEQQRQEKSA